jgi:flagellar biosynthesis protein FlhF
MQIHSFIADSAADAVAQIRAQLGPEAVVLNVRKVAGEGLSRLWQKPRIEVLAHLPEQPAPVLNAVDALAELREELAAIRNRVDSRTVAPLPKVEMPPEPILPEPVFMASTVEDSKPSSTWRIAKYLENTGLLPLHAQRVVDRLCARHGENPPTELAKELNVTRALLAELWPASRAQIESRVHLFIGAAGVGKTTCVCKWLAQSVLVEGRTAHVWRLDGRTANTAESLSVYCEILGVPLERLASPSGVPAGVESLFIDVPGVNWTDASAVQDLARLMAVLPPAQVHLVLNTAYEVPVLMAQVRAFSALPITDLIFTHLDEEARWGKIWNFVFGTNYTPGFLSAGQNVPGDFFSASVEKILSRQFPCK